VLDARIGWYVASNCERDVHYRDGIIVEDCRDVFRGELVGSVADEQARLTDGTVTDDDTPIVSKR
jgi:hypothetical protein